MLPNTVLGGWRKNSFAILTSAIMRNWPDCLATKRVQRWYDASVSNAQRPPAAKSRRALRSPAGSAPTL
eukprot:4807111-Lingulodinium_polyedra.AAC.1